MLKSFKAHLLNIYRTWKKYIHYRAFEKYTNNYNVYNILLCDVSFQHPPASVWNR